MRLLITIVIFLSCFGSFAQGIELLQKEIKLGDVLEGHDVNVDFLAVVKAESVTVTGLDLDCACLLANDPKGDYSLGDTIKVSLSFNTTNRPGAFAKEVKLNTSIDTLKLAFSGYVLPQSSTAYKNELFGGKISVESEIIRLGNVYEGQRKLLRVRNLGKDSLTVSALLESTLVKIADGGITLPPNSDASFIVKVGVGTKYGFNQDSISFRLQGKTESLILQYNYLPKVAPCTSECPKLLVAKSDYNYGSVKAGTKTKLSYELMNNGDGVLVVYNLQLPCDCLSSEQQFPVRLAAGETLSLELLFDTKGFTAAQNKVFYVFTNAPDQVVKKMGLKGKVL